MRKITWRTITAIRIAAIMIAPIAIGAFSAATALAAGDLARDFARPPDSARMWVWWHWLGSQMTPESITGDLEQFKAQELGGATVFSVVSPSEPTRPAPKFMSPPWRELFKHALREADRLGLGVGMNLCSSWSAGGPWITPELACKKYTFAELTVEGPRKFIGKLPLPPSDPRLYRDVALQAVRIPTPLDPKQRAERLALMKIKNG